MRSLFRLFLVAFLVSGAACASRNGQGGAARQEGAFLRIQNQAWLDMTVFVVEGSGARRRLGIVTSNSTSTFRIPDTVVGIGRQLRFVADPVGSSNTASSFEMYVRPGEQVRLTIPPMAGR